MSVENYHQVLQELTLLLLYLTSWKEKTKIGRLRRSWKTHRFEILDDLKEKGYLSGSKRSKSVYLTEDGIDKALEFQEKYLG